MHTLVRCGLIHICIYTWCFRNYPTYVQIRFYSDLYCEQVYGAVAGGAFRKKKFSKVNCMVLLYSILRGELTFENIYLWDARMHLCALEPVCVCA